VQRSISAIRFIDNADYQAVAAAKRDTHAEFERAMIRQRSHAGLERAVANGKTVFGPVDDATSRSRKHLIQYGV
jgi:DNA invertase Pin-like site-specific DNA recombinase